MPVERGIAKMLGMHPVAAPRLTIDAPHEVAVAQYAGWAGLAAEALDGYDALYVHIKGPDVPAHDGRAEDKRDVIAAIDAGFFSEIMRIIDPSIDDRRRHGGPLDLMRAQGAHRRTGPTRGEWGRRRFGRLDQRSGSERAPPGPWGSSEGSISCPA